MKILSKLAKINAVILVALLFAIIVEFFDVGNWAIFALSIMAFVFFAATLILIGLIAFIVFLFGNNYSYKFNDAALTKMLIIKTMQKFVYIVIAILIYIQFHNAMGLTSIQWDDVVGSLIYSYPKINFGLVDIFTSLLFIKSFLKDNNNRRFGFFVWILTVFPVLDIIIIASLKHKSKETV